MPAGLSVPSSGTALYKGTGAGKTLIPDMWEFPDLMGEPDALDTTVTTDTIKTSRPGLPDPGALQFTFLYTGMVSDGTSGANWSILYDVQDSGEPEDFTILFADGSGLQFNAYVSLQILGKGSNDVMQFRASFQLTGEMVPIGEMVPPLLTFVTVKGTGAKATKITSVTPVLGGSNTYVYKLNVEIPDVGAVLTGKGFTAYTLADDIPTVADQKLVLVEVNASGAVLKAGSASTVIT